MEPSKNTEEAELIRKRYLYRRLILTKKVALPRRSATQLIGPDCAYHLYGQLKPSDLPEENDTTSPRLKED